MDIGLAGMGNMGRNHLRVLSRLKGCALAAACDPEPSAKKYAAQFGVPFYTSLGEMLEKEELDAVDLVVPTPLHERLALQCLAAGKHVFVEKPIAASTAAGRRMVRAAEGRRRLLMVGHIERFNPAVRALKKALEGEKLVSLSFTRVGPIPPRQADVGVVVDMGIHDLDLLRYLTGKEAESVFCAASESKGRSVEDSAQLLVRMRGGASAQFTFNWNTPFKVRRIEVVTARKVFHADLISNDVKAFYGYRIGANPSFSTDQIAVSHTEPLAAELSHFCDCVKTGKAPITSGQDAVEALKIAEAALESAKSGSVAKLRVR